MGKTRQENCGASDKTPTAAVNANTTPLRQGINWYLWWDLYRKGGRRLSQECRGPGEILQSVMESGCLYRLTAVNDNHRYWYCCPEDDTACSMVSNPMKAMSLIPWGIDLIWESSESLGCYACWLAKIPRSGHLLGGQQATSILKSRLTVLVQCNIYSYDPQLRERMAYCSHLISPLKRWILILWSAWWRRTRGRYLDNTNTLSPSIVSCLGCPRNLRVLQNIFLRDKWPSGNARASDWDLLCMVNAA